MNLIDLTVTRIKGHGNPYQITSIKNHWFLKVEAEAYGRISQHILMFNTKEEAENIKIGYVFQG